jgi:hypothetical protein
MTIQHHTFSNSHFVLHKITGDFRGKVSAWFNDDGHPTDAELIRPNGSLHPIKRDGLIWQQLRSLGRIYRA